MITIHIYLLSCFCICVCVAEEVPIRLVNGCQSNEGRLEIFYQHRWGTVCDDGFDLVAAHIVCKQLGFDHAERSKCCAYFGPGRGRIWLDNISCQGNETFLHQCSHGGWSTHNCNHNEDISIICATSAEIRLRLQDGKNNHEGRLEVFYSGKWGTICSDYFDEMAADVACRQLGYINAFDYACCGQFGLGHGPIWMDDLRCNGSETSLYQCSARPFGCSNCDHFQDVGLICNPTELSSTQIRLAGGDDQNGRLEIYASGQWGTICDDEFQFYEAAVACRQLGFGNAKIVYNSGKFGPGRGPIWLDNLLCYGNETNLLDCVYKKLGSHDCTHAEDVGIGCFTANPKIRLVNGGSFYGRVEIEYNNISGTICDHDFDLNDAIVICRQLGFIGVHQIKFYGPGSGPIYVDKLNCKGYESNLFQCAHSGFGKHNCQHVEDVGIECLPAVAANISDINCTFQYDICGWQQSINDELNWTRNAGKTPSKRTGPTSDHTVGTSKGYYAYLEASNRRRNDSAILISRTFELSSNYCFSLWYNANGKGIGSLLVKNYNATQVISTGHRRNVWRKAQILLGYGSHQLQIIALRGNSYRGDLAIDDLEIRKGQCPPLSCSDNPCIHGKCRSIRKKLVCRCFRGYKGKFCDQSRKK